MANISDVPVPQAQCARGNTRIRWPQSKRGERRPKWPIQKTGKPFGKKKNRILYTVYAAMTVILAISICCAINRVLSHNCESSWDRGCRLDFTFHDCKQGQDLRKEQPAAEE